MRAHFKWSWLLLLAYGLLLACGSVFVSARGPRVSTSKLKASVVSQEDGKLSFLALNPGSCLKGSSKKNKLTIVANGCNMEMRWDDTQFFFGDRGVLKHKDLDVPVDVSNGNLKFGYDDSSNNKMNCEVKFKKNNNTEQGGYVVDLRIEDVVKTCSNIVIEFNDGYKLYVPPRASTPEDEKKIGDTTPVIVSSVLGSLLLLIALGFSLYCCWWKKRGLKQGAPWPTQVVVPAQKPEPSQINRTTNVSVVTAVSNTHVKTTQTKPTPFQLPAPVPIPMPVPVPFPMPVPTPVPVPVPEPAPVLAPVTNTSDIEAIDRQREISRRNAKAVDEDEQKRKKKKYRKKKE